MPSSSPPGRLLATATLAFRTTTPPLLPLAGEDAGISSLLIVVYHPATVPRAENGRHLLTLIGEADRSCLCIEPDRAWFEGGPRVCGAVRVRLPGRGSRGGDDGAPAGDGD